ncbi:glycosyltransferase family 4 protein [Hahella sp. SMD15-11]|uniref:Glycosyltransferase family 4 protein n=1 Tax=Thermohahella caldifontis TaxID=3142973 RepID=A0AB39USM7_9GAMM
MTAIVASFAAIFSGARTFFWQSGTTHEWDWAQPFGFKKLRWFLKSYIPGFVARKMTTYFVTGPEYMVDYYESIVGVKKEKIKLLYNDIDIERFSCSTTEKRIAKTDFLNSLSLPADTKILLIVHRLSPVRRTGFYFRQLLLRFKGAAEASKTIIVIAGGGCELEELKKISAEYELENKCVFMGEVPNNKIQSLYKVADLFLHPTFNEGFPRVILEAMASGLPIVSTNAGGSEQLVGPKQKMFVVDKNDPVMFTNKVVELLNDCRLQQSLAYENLEYVRRFSTENVVLMYKKVLFDEK